MFLVKFYDLYYNYPSFKLLDSIDDLVIWLRHIEEYNETKQERYTNIEITQRFNRKILNNH